jgi:hypothetical protein
VIDRRAYGDTSLKLPKVGKRGRVAAVIAAPVEDRFKRLLRCSLSACVACSAYFRVWYARPSQIDYLLLLPNRLLLP